MEPTGQLWLRLLRTQWHRLDRLILMGTKGMRDHYVALADAQFPCERLREVHRR